MLSHAADAAHRSDVCAALPDPRARLGRRGCGGCRGPRGPVELRAGRLSAAAHPRCGRSGARSALLRLPGDAVAHRRRLWWPLRQGLARRHADAAALPADAAHRLRLLGAGRGMGLHGKPARPRALPVHAALGFVDREELEGRFRHDAGRRAGRDSLLASRDQRRDGARSRAGDRCAIAECH